MLAMDSMAIDLLLQIDQLGKEVSASNGHVLQTKARRQLISATRKLRIALQDPGEIVEDFLFGSTDNLLIKIGVDLGIFRLIAEAEDPTTLDQLSKSIQIERVLLERIMRGLVAIDAVDETGPQLYGPTNTTKAFASTKGESGARLFHDLVIPGMKTTPAISRRERLRESGRFQPSTIQLGLRTRVVLSLDFYPFEEQVVHGFDDQDPSSVLVVDIGGSMGQEILEIKQHYIALPGRMIVQDLPSTIEQVIPAGAFEAIAHDFFTPQPVKGARAYYLRNILHDWDDDKCLEILRHTVAAMKPGYSKIIINEFVIADQNPCAFAMRSDFMVMALAGAKERAEREWHVLLESAGLKIDRVWTAEPESQSIIEASIA
ncbi:O-methyltransferase-domain-containing protein [Massariosphaeria phaeospora]|uniref:O-methyltransferase-domain-containing protein n=1 Tax=Massariosphaeria phaeospora TaxID=100035 RepID=A0A7C8M8W5_9PLEO|nr:O-methyltransferase-domain-containing protein [Massariosphaeria phaeospora]